MEAVAARRRLNQRKRRKIADIEKALAVGRLIKDPENWTWFRDKYASISSSMEFDKGVSSKRNYKYQMVAFLKSLSSIPNKSIMWKFNITVDFLKACEESNTKADAVRNEVYTLAKRARLGVEVLETRFTTRNINQYDGLSKRTVDTRGRL